MSIGTSERGEPAKEPVKPRTVKGTDFATLFGPVTLSTDTFGEISLPLRTAGFLAWYEEGKKADRWKGDGDAFVRAMLAEQAATGENKEPLQRDLLASLDPAQIEQIASSITALIGESLVRSTQGGGEEIEQGPSPAPSEPAKLLRMVDDYYARYQKAAKRMAEQFLKNDSLTTIRKALAQTSTFQLESDKLRSTVESMNAASRFLAQRPLFAQLEMSGASTFLEQQSQIAKSIREIVSPLHNFGPNISLAERFKPLIDRSLHEQIMGSRLAWAKTVSTGFNLALTSDVASSFGASLTAAQTVAKFMADARFDRLGFQATANLALDGFVAPGAAADILRRYDEERRLHGPIFDDVLEAVRSLDDDELGADPAAAAERAWHTIARGLSAKMPHLDAAAWLALAALVVSVVGTIIAYEALQEQRRTDQSVKLERIQTEVSAWHVETKAARAADEEAARYIRYVHETAVLRTDPDRTGALIRLVYPDQLLRVIEAKKGWVLVEVFDYGTDKPLRGWIARRNLRIRPAN